MKNVSRLGMTALLLCTAAAAHSDSEKMADMLDRVRPTVVRIETQGEEGSGVGTGFMVRKDGLIMTADHVVKNARSIRVNFSDDKTLNVEQVVLEDPANDFALVKVKGSNFPVLPLGDASVLRQGDRIVAVGCPLDLGFTVTDGIVSALRDDKGHTTRKGESPMYLQVSAPISPGNSGGPVINMKGEAVGVAVFKMKDGENLNFALTTNRIEEVIAHPAENAAPQADPDADPTEPDTSQDLAPHNRAPKPATQAEPWFTVTSKSHDADQTCHFVKGGDPVADADWLQEKWGENYAITNIAQGNGRWAIVMTKGTDYETQSVFTDSTYPSAKVKEKWDQGYFITQSVYGAGRWVVVMSKYAAGTADGMEQYYVLADTLPESKIQDRFNKGFRLTNIDGDGKQWAVVMTKGGKLAAQRYKTFKGTLPKDWIKTNWDAGYYITCVGMNKDEYILVMSQGTDYTQQSYNTGDGFPEDWLKKQWDDNALITSLR